MDVGIGQVGRFDDAYTFARVLAATAVTDHVISRLRVAQQGGVGANVAATSRTGSGRTNQSASCLEINGVFLADRGDVGRSWLKGNRMRKLDGCGGAA